jgi:serine/threonine protein phosphatase PrpC
VADNEIRDLLLLTESFEEATARLAAAANQAGGKDNVTLVLGTLRQFSVGG